MHIENIRIFKTGRYTKYRSNEKQVDFTNSETRQGHSLYFMLHCLKRSVKVPKNAISKKIMFRSCVLIQSDLERALNQKEFRKHEIKSYSITDCLMTI